MDSTGKLLASDIAAGDHLGSAVAVHSHTVVVGALGDDDAGIESGSAYIFTRSGDVWTEQAKLFASDAAPSDWFGWSAALEGDTAIVGAIGDDDGRALWGGLCFHPQQRRLGGAGETSPLRWRHRCEFRTRGGRQRRNAPHWRAGAPIRFMRLSKTAPIGWKPLTSPPVKPAPATVSDTRWALTGTLRLSARRLLTRWATWQGLRISLNAPAPHGRRSDKCDADRIAAHDEFGASVAIDGDFIIAGARFHDTPQSNSGAAFVFPSDASAEPDERDFPIGDVSGDRAVNAYDAALILQFSVGMIGRFPVEDLIGASPEKTVPRHYQVSVPKLTARRGERIRVPISMNETTGFLAGGVTLKYDPAAPPPRQRI